MSNTDTNFFQNHQMGFIERAILAEDIKLPFVTRNKITEHWLCCHDNEYRSAFNMYKDTLGKFFLPIMTPLVDKESAKTGKGSTGSSRGNKGNLNTASTAKSSNYVELYIPKYILMNFRGTIPKGTEFIVASIGGSIEIEDMRIIGIFTMPIPDNDEGWVDYRDGEHDVSWCHYHDHYDDNGRPHN